MVSYHSQKAAVGCENKELTKKTRTSFFWIQIAFTWAEVSGKETCEMQRGENKVSYKSTGAN